jgi:hypothetical protein
VPVCVTVLQAQAALTAEATRIECNRLTAITSYVISVGVFAIEGGDYDTYNYRPVNINPS